MRGRENAGDGCSLKKRGAGSLPFLWSKVEVKKKVESEGQTSKLQVSNKRAGIQEESSISGHWSLGNSPWGGWGCQRKVTNSSLGAEVKGLIRRGVATMRRKGETWAGRKRKQEVNQKDQKKEKRQDVELGVPGQGKSLGGLSSLRRQGRNPRARV